MFFDVCIVKDCKCKWIRIVCCLPIYEGSSALKKAVSVGSRRQTSSSSAKGRRRVNAKSPQASDQVAATADQASTAALRKIPAAVAAAAALALPSTPRLTAEASADGSIITFPAESPADVFDMPVDPNEPTYCL